ncbi:MAG: hypothetical protein CW716_01975 [Candidatus Bathyarchaeum sp.]|nr:MAG: hypothetical protein CW716_01975 [Candidatus Bathyarchaeum sp.]
MSWMEDLKRLHFKQKVSIAEINDYLLGHPEWTASIIKNTLGFEMYREFCLCCENFDKCYEKLGTIKKETSFGCICNEFLNQERFKASNPKLRAYFKGVTEILNL